MADQAREVPKVIWARPERSGRGPAPSLRRADIAAAAVRLADADGIEAVSMRALAGTLGVGATSLYRYVESKEEVIDLMVDHAFGIDFHFEPSDDPRANLARFARAMRSLLLAHPWMAVHGAGRPTLGPHVLAMIEAVLGSIDGLGLEIDAMLLAVGTIDAFVRGRVLDQLAEQEAIRRSGFTQEEWLERMEPWMAGILENERFPLVKRVVIDARTPHDPDRIEMQFEGGLEQVLDGLLASVEPRSDVP
ncbi:MAG TPA: TetR/AcrR family transcriptional regulator C-terminal domain-containing protein [Solirubrobacterales bacterium]|nr:TetR/AcrR family transcriptional regulator C-terminal domain-containing protein [Solirubrobacterales bacterium]